MPPQNYPPTLQVIVVDVSPLIWGERDIERAALDKKRAAEKKSSIGPAILPHVLESVVAYCSSLLTIERDAGIIVIIVADDHHRIVHPAKEQMAAWLQSPEIFTTNLRSLQTNLVQGVTDLLSRIEAEQCGPTHNKGSTYACIAAAFSVALCTLNRFLVAAHAGTTARPEHFLERQDDAEIVALMNHTSARGKLSTGQSSWSPRILLLQASPDRSRDYNAFMNCTFAAMKQGVVVDACFLASSGQTSSSAFLEQACDLTGGLFLAPTGVAQVGGALTQVWLTVFLSPSHLRSKLHLPASNKVDFRAQCFDTGRNIDVAYTCNQCLSVFSQMPSQPQCPTCQSTIVKTSSTRRRSSVG